MKNASNELLRQYRSWEGLAVRGRLDDGDELQDMRAKRFQALVDLQMLLLFDEAATSKAESSVAAGEPLPCLAATAPRNS